MNGLYPYLMALFLSAGIVYAVHPFLVRLAFKRGIVDNPNARKLNRVPVPVLGGVGVFLGLILALYAVIVITQVDFPHCYMLPLLLMLVMGGMDDVYDLRPRTKFVVQILAVLLLFFLCNLRINSLHGLFGIYEIPISVSLPLTLVSCVGLINAMNLIDGIDGLSSGYSIVASGLFAILAFVQDDSVNLLISSSLIGALIPFFVYNVFGRRNKMFIGDAGSHLLGMLFCIMALHAMSVPLLDKRVEGAVVPFLVAVFSLPIMDTLRVMTMRICRGNSPFRADKTHLHHALIGRGLTHLTTTLSIIGVDLIVVAAWLVCYKCGLAATDQILVVLVMSLLCVVLPYPILKRK